MSSSSEQRAFWNDLRRATLQTLATIQKSRPDDPFSIEITVVKRPTVSSTSSQ